MLTLIGGLLLLVFAYLFVANKLNETISKKIVEIEKHNKELTYERSKKVPSLLPTLDMKPFWFLAGAVLFFALKGMFFYNPAGTATAIQYPWGGDRMVKTQGLKVKAWGRVIPISYETAIKDVFSNSEGKIPESEDALYYRSAKLWEFSDAIKAKIASSVVIGIEIEDEESFLSMADKNKSENKLIRSRVTPNIDAALKNTAKLMDAQEYISGKASDFDRYFRDQLENGMYLVEQYVHEEKTKEVIGDTNIVRTIGNNGKNRQTKYRIKRDTQGNILRDNNSNSLSQYGIKIYQAQITAIDWEASFDDRLKLQKEQVALTQLEKQQAEREFYRAKKEIAKGESEKAKERARLEKEQIQQTIASETRAKVAEQDLIAEKKRVEVSRLKAQQQKIAADAQYYENAKLVSAGLTPQEKAEWAYKTNIGVAKELKDLRLPQTYIESGNSNSKSNLLESLIGAEMAKSMLKSSK